LKLAKDLIKLINQEFEKKRMNIKIKDETVNVPKKSY